MGGGGGGGDRRAGSGDRAGGSRPGAELDRVAGTTGTKHGPGAVGILTPDRFGAVSNEWTVANYVVVYDPNGSFVTGGGFINSPAGASTPMSSGIVGAMSICDRLTAIRFGAASGT